jgi:hypothetical protein
VQRHFTLEPSEYRHLIADLRRSTPENVVLVGARISVSLRRSVGG